MCLRRAGCISMKSVKELLDKEAKGLWSSVTYWDVFIAKKNERIDAIKLYETTEYKEILATKEKQKKDIKLFLDSEVAKHGVVNE